MAFYGDISAAQELAGDAAGEITNSMQSVINAWIDLNIRQDGFSEYSAEEYYDIKLQGQKELVLRKFPVTLTEYIKTGRAPSLVELPTTNYVVDADSGIIQLIQGQFPVGSNIVVVKYKYGFSAVPDDIKQIANLMLAKWAEIAYQQSDADGLKQVKIGDYQETRDSSFMGINSKYDPILNPMIEKAKGRYHVGV